MVKRDGLDGVANACCIRLRICDRVMVFPLTLKAFQKRTWFDLHGAANWKLPTSRRLNTIDRFQGSQHLVSRSRMNAAHFAS